MPSGAGYEVVFCPVGHSTIILSTLGSEMRTLAATGKVPKPVLSNLQNSTYIKMKSIATGHGARTSMLVMLVCAVFASVLMMA